MDAVVHLTFGDRAFDNEAEVWQSNLQVNLIGTYNVLEAAAQAGVRRVALASRAGVHGGWGEPEAWVQRTVEQRTRPV